MLLNDYLITHSCHKEHSSVYTKCMRMKKQNLTDSKDNYWIKKNQTYHSSRPWALSGLNLLTATASLSSTPCGLYVTLSTHPLKTFPKPPSPMTLSCRKFIVLHQISWVLQETTYHNREQLPKILKLWGRCIWQTCGCGYCRWHRCSHISWVLWCTMWLFTIT